MEIEQGVTQEQFEEFKRLRSLIEDVAVAFEKEHCRTDQDVAAMVSTMMHWALGRMIQLAGPDAAFALCIGNAAMIKGVDELREAFEDDDDADDDAAPADATIN